MNKHALKQVFPSTPETRSEAREQAWDEAFRLQTETGLDHHHFWNGDESRYEVWQTEPSVPEQAWDNEDNRPRKMPTDWKALPTQFTALDRLLIDAACLKPSQWLSANSFHDDPAQKVRDLQAALDVQYGRGRFWASRHGSRISIQCRM